MHLELLGSSGEEWIFQSSESSGNLFRIRVVQHSTNSTHTKEKVLISKKSKEHARTVHSSVAEIRDML